MFTLDTIHEFASSVVEKMHVETPWLAHVSEGHDRENNAEGVYVQFAKDEGCCETDKVIGVPWSIMVEGKDRENFGSQCSGCGAMMVGYSMGETLDVEALVEAKAAEYAAYYEVDQAEVSLEDIEDEVRDAIEKHWAALRDELHEANAEKDVKRARELKKDAERLATRYREGQACNWDFDADLHDSLDEARDEYLDEYMTGSDLKPGVFIEERQGKVVATAWDWCAGTTTGDYIVEEVEI